jgi:hypothetical protein
MSAETYFRALLPAQGWRVLSCSIGEDYDDNSDEPKEVIDFRYLPVVGFAITDDGDNQFGNDVELLVWDSDEGGVRVFGSTHYSEAEKMFGPDVAITDEDKQMLTARVRRQIARHEEQKTALEARQKAAEEEQRKSNEKWAATQKK